MQVELQIPITDLRMALPDASGKTTTPSWPEPILSQHPFVRNFGYATRRKDGGSAVFIGEEYFCMATRAIRFQDLHNQTFTPAAGQSIFMQQLSRRLFTDGKFSSRVEISFRTATVLTATAGNPDPAAAPVKLDALLKQQLSVPVTVPLLQHKKTTPLYDVGRPLAKLFYRSTTRHGKASEEEERLVLNGEVCALVMLHTSEAITLPAGATLIEHIVLPDQAGNLKLYGATIEINSYSIKLWIILADSTITTGTVSGAILRNLYINLMRIHSEKETIRIVLNARKSGLIDLSGDNPNAQALVDYLEATGKLLFRKRRYKIEQANMLDFALKSEDSISPGAFQRFAAEIKNSFLRKNLVSILEKSQQGKKRILFMCSNPENKSDLSFTEEYQSIKRLLRKSNEREHYQIDIEFCVQRDEVAELLSTFRPDILHVSLHSSKVAGLYFRDHLKQVDPMGVPQWVDIMQVQNNIHQLDIVIISACNSQEHAKGIKGITRFVAGTNNVFPDLAAVDYAKGFYGTLFSGAGTHPAICHQAGVNAIKYNPLQLAVGAIPAHSIIQQY